jgi:hypothetical protein
MRGQASLVRLEVSGLSWALFWGACYEATYPLALLLRECATASAMILLHSQARYRKMLVLLLLRRTLIVLSPSVLREERGAVRIMAHLNVLYY